MYSSFGDESSAQNPSDNPASSTPNFMQFVLSSFPNLAHPGPAHQPNSSAPTAQRPFLTPANSNNQITQSPVHQPSPTASNEPSTTTWTEAEWQKVYSNTPDGVAELRARWEADLSRTELPPPPPEVHATKQEGIDAVKNFAKDHGYVLVIGHSYKDKFAANGETNKVLLTCEMGGYFRDHFKKNPGTRVRNRMSRKTGCPMKILISKRRFSDEWVTVIKDHKHNHGAYRAKVTLTASKMPELEDALHDWHMAEIARGEAVHGNTLKARALAMYAEMPQYRGKSPPNLDRDWLDQYRMRYNLPGKVTRPPIPGIVRGPNNPEPTPINVEEQIPLEPPAFADLEGIFPLEQNLFWPTKQFVQEYMSRYDASHDFKHVTRVFALSRRILEQETQTFQGVSYDPQAVLLAAMLHDVGDHKYHKPGENPENQIAEHLLEHGASPDLAMKVQLIAKNVSFSNEVKNPRMMKAVLDQHPELAIVQDADRLDAIGAVGIGRCFAFGAVKQSDRGLDGSIEHFVEKLERLENMMKTHSGRELARERTQRLQIFRQWWDEETSMQI
ncbi:hypothetical protein KCV03_g3630, partial [Aureobasidium melanogenum]